MTSLAARPGTEVEPTWSMATASNPLVDATRSEHLLANRRLDLRRHCGPGRHGIGECRERPQWTLPNGTLMTRRSRCGSGISGLGHRGGRVAVALDDGVVTTRSRRRGWRCT